MPPTKRKRRASTRKRAPKKRTTTRKAGGTRKRAGAKKRGGTRKHAPRTGAYGERARGYLSEEIRHHVKDKGMPQDQAVAAAMSEARRKGMTVPREPKGED